MNTKIKDVLQSVEKIKSELIDYISNEFVKGIDLEISSDYALLGNGVIDSLSIMTLIVHLEEQYSLDFYKIDVTRDRFSSIDTISQMVMENIEQPVCRDENTP